MKLKKGKNLSHKILSDGEILKRSQKEPWLFGMLVNRYQKSFLRKSQVIVRSLDLAEDIVQDVFLKIYKNASSFHETSGTSFNSWAYKILLNTSYTYYARQKAELAYITHMDSVDIDALDVVRDENFEISDRHSLVESILVRMPQSIARLLRLYFLEGKSQKEIALLERTSPGAIRVRMYRAKRYFRDNFKDIKLFQDLISN